MNKQKRTGNVSVEQKKEIIEFMEKHPALKNGKFTNDFTFKKAQLLWQELENKLNSLPGGAKKDWRQWRKTWQDMKGSAKKKNALIKTHMRATGGGPSIDTDLTDEEIKLIDIMGTVVVEGDPKVLESNCELNFESCDEAEIIFDNDHDYATQMQEVEAPKLADNTFAKMDISLEDSDNCTIVNTTSLTNKKGKTPVRVQRLDKAISANNKLVELTENKINQKEKYYSAKLELYEINVVENERIAVALENILILLTNKYSVD